MWYKSLKARQKEPWENFRNDVLSTLENIFVSRPPRRNATGEIHKATIKSKAPGHKNFDKDTVRSGIEIRGGVADNGGQVRTDVFMKKNKKDKAQYFLVPIYISDMGKELPNKIVTIGSPKAEWKELDDTYEFMFSLYPNDLVLLEKGENKTFGYFNGTHISNATINIEVHDRSKPLTSAGVKTVDKIEKFAVDILGRYNKVNKEQRMPLNHKGRKQTKGKPDGLACPSSDKTV
jgi:CRISPR-associated endonuclease Csn1